MSQMRFADYTKRILGLAKTVYLWLGVLTALDPARRERIAKYADTIARTLARATKALTRLQNAPADRKVRSKAIRELAQINGYIETIVEVLEHQLDGRKLAGVKRRLEQIGISGHHRAGTVLEVNTSLDRLAAAEGYFRALADGLRA